jgi:predicted AlkP superfamily phosphohydrolase/phosphomutase
VVVHVSARLGVPLTSFLGLGLGIVLALSSAVPAQSRVDRPPRVIVVSLDGAGFALTSRIVAQGRLPSFQRLLREGTWSDGMVSSFPTKTAAAHAMIFTGRYGHESGITGNSLLRVPPGSGSRLETLSGYFTDALVVDAVWAIAARAGMDSYVLHLPQLYPFHPLDHLYAAHGYTEKLSEGEALDPRNAPLDSPDSAWRVPEARGAEAREIRFVVGESKFRGLFFDDPIDPTLGCDTLGIAEESDLSEFVARVKAGDTEGFSVPVTARIAGGTASFELRLFTLSADGSLYLLYRTGAHEMARTPPDFPGAGLTALDAYSGNGGTDAYSSGGLGPTRASGGHGEAERRFLETESQLLEQLIAQARLVLSRDYRLVVLYSPITDNVAHQLVGYLDPDLEGYDPALADALWPVLEGAFALQDRFLGVLLEAAERDSASLLVVSDHGMTATNHIVRLNDALRQAGLLKLGPDGNIDLSRTRALAPPLSDASIAVNTVDRPGGIVPMDERGAVLDEARRALASLVDPGSGGPIVTAFFEPATTGLLQPGGASTGDLFLDFAPGYYPSTDTGSDAVVEKTEPRGEHIFVPTRRDMLAIFAAWGPRFLPGGNVGRVQAIDVTPTILDLLGITAPPGLPGRSLVTPKGILN